MRAAHGLTFASLSEMTDIPIVTLQRYFAGTRGMPASALRAVAKALDVSADWLLFGGPWHLDPHKLARALEAHQSIVEASNGKLSWEAYAEIFAKSYEYWNRPDPRDIREEKLARMGIKVVDVPKDPPGEV